MKRFILVVLATLASISHTASAYIYDVQVVRRWDPQLKEYQHVVGLCDYHDRMHPENKIQRAQIESVLAQSTKDNMCVVVEDLSCRGDGSKQAFCSNFVVNTRGGILGGLAEFCSQRGINVANVEYRYCRVAAIGPMLRHAHAPLQEFKAIHEVSVNTLVDEIQGEVQNVEKFVVSDKKLKDWYASSMKEIETGLKRLHLDKHQEMTLAQYLTAHSQPEKRFLLLNELLTFDSILLDLKLVHTVANMPDKKLIVVIAGGTHINRMNDALKTQGFTMQHPSSVSYKKEANLSKCLGANVVDGSFCIKPQPVDILATMHKYVIGR
jgi:hypothetical protein